MPSPGVPPSRPFRPLVLLFFLILCLGVGWAGSSVTRPEIPGWFASLVKPAWNPPAWVFGPVWTVLYISMAVSAWLVVRERPKGGAAGPLSLFFIQLLLNGLWSLLFFGWHRPDLAFVDIVLLWMSIGMTLASFWYVRPLAGKLLLPYWAWATFAAALNLAIWRMNS
jgi:benzodiazapine receptor